MNNFWTLVKFEYKKIFMKKSTIIGCILAIIFIMFSTFAVLIGNEYKSGEVVASKYESMVLDREYARKLSGRPIDKNLIMDTARAYCSIPEFFVGQYPDTDEYQNNAREYSEIYRISKIVYNNVIADHFTYSDMQKLTYVDADEFYNIRDEKVRDRIKGYNINDNTRKKLIDSNSNIKQPIIYNYIGGYNKYFATSYTAGLIAIFIISIVLAPIFCGEYKGSDQIILASKNGKSSLIKAKLFTGFSISSIISIITSLLIYVLCMMIFGSDGVDAVIQVKVPLCELSLTIGQTAVLFTLCLYFACILIAATTMMISVKAKSSFIVIIIMSIIIVSPMFINISENHGIFCRITMLLPSNMIGFWSFISPMYFEIFELSIEPYIFMYLFSFIFSIAVLPIIYIGFKNHQVN